ncbi:MAG: DUF4386 domain-containing protein [Cytophagales bacterium]|nr:DUF4386 domain-containing protein [Cytophagales bacterium]
MKLQSLENQKMSKLAGVLYLLIAIVGGFSIGYMPSVIIVDDNVAITFQNLIQNKLLFRLGILGDIAVLIMEVLLTVLLFQLFKKVDIVSMRIATYARMAMAIIMSVNLVLYLIPLFIVENLKVLEAFSQSELESLVFLFLKAHSYSVFTWQIFFAIHLLFLGWVLLESKVVSKWLGVCMIIGSLGYGGDSITHLLMIDQFVLTITFSILLFFAVVSEFWFLFWLFFKGISNDEN